MASLIESGLTTGQFCVFAHVLLPDRGYPTVIYSLFACISVWFPYLSNLTLGYFSKSWLSSALHLVQTQFSSPFGSLSIAGINSSAQFMQYFVILSPLDYQNAKLKYQHGLAFAYIHVVRITGKIALANQLVHHTSDSTSLGAASCQSTSIQERIVSKTVSRLMA